MNNDFSAVDRRIEYLKRKLYEYDSFGRTDAQLNPASALQKSIDQNAYQDELTELMTLRELADKARQPTGIATWQAAVIATFSGVAIAMATASIYLVLYVH